MRALEFLAEVDAQGRVAVTLPPNSPRGLVRVLVLIPEGEEDAPGAGAEAAARERVAELADEQEDLYALADGDPTAPE
jgi:hypothetical protein